MKLASIAVALFAVSTVAQAANETSPHYTAPYNVVWTSPSHDAAGSMPLGNGQVGINLWVEEDGDLRFYISRNDSFTEVSRLVKVGGVRISLDPNPFKKGMKFQQELKLAEGVCAITAGQEDSGVSIVVFVSANSPTISVIGSSSSPVKVKVTADLWRTKPHALTGEELNSSWTLHKSPTPVVESADVVPTIPADVMPTIPVGEIAWYHRNETSPAFAATLKIQSLDSIAAKAHDPLRHRTFGGYLSATGWETPPVLHGRNKPAFFHRVGGNAIESTALRDFGIRIATPCFQATSAAEWIRQAQETRYPQLAEHLAAWHDFWDRSRIIVSGDQVAGVPGSEHPLRIGYDSNGGNKFPGEIVVAALYNRALSAEELAKHAKDDPALKHGPPLPGFVFASIGGPRTIDELKGGKPTSELTLEACIKPTVLSPGRILDRLTAGGSDGFLFDTHPGDTLRLIVGSNILSARPKLIQVGKTYHVAATYNATTGAMRIYLDGRLVAQRDDAVSASITRAYTLQRYMQAIGGRGPFPIKFNGGQFTVEPKAMGKPHNADWRAWGDCFWWQNTRHMYHPMLAAGDFDLMDPLFDMYEAARPLADARAKLYHGAEGCYFPETMTVWGTYSNGDYGWNRAGHEPKDVQCPWWQYAWNQGPELVGLLLDRWDYTGDEKFLTERVLPMAESVLKYFDTRFKKDNEGRIVLDPTQSVETYWHGVVNDMPSTAGLNDITARLCALPERLVSTTQREFFQRMRAACPTVPVEEVKVRGKTIRRLAPAQKYNPTASNCEDPELYGIWPFRLYGVGRPGLEDARAAYATRHNHLDVGWGYDGNCAALLGLTDEAARILKVKCANSNHAYRWPATWGPNFDWLPDQNHGGNLLETTQLMLLQPVGDKLLVLPAWPKTWDVDFKLHAPRQTVVECVYRGGRIERLIVTPDSRRADIVLP
jgi:hypothetical protein